MLENKNEIIWNIEHCVSHMTDTEHKRTGPYTFNLSSDFKLNNRHYVLSELNTTDNATKQTPTTR